MTIISNTHSDDLINLDKNVSVANLIENLVFFEKRVSESFVPKHMVIQIYLLEYSMQGFTSFLLQLLQGCSC